jgi:hypothetical protein
MATLSAIAYNVFEGIGPAKPKIEVMVREPLQYEVSEHQPLRMRWVHETDPDGHSIMRARWVEEIESNVERERDY